ncbi:MAG: TonB-dependent receptor [Flavobacteriales bacterium]|nr:TonB-dependent receptor [Flavobacteriales bacterium]
MYKLIRLHLTAIALLALCTVYGQNASVMGKVVDKLDDKPIEFATITLNQQADSAVVNGTVSDAQGMFLLEDLSVGKYFIKIKFIGFDPMYINDIQIKEKGQLVNLETIGLTPAETLDEVEVVANKSPFEVKIDKKIFNADENITAKGGTGLDLIRQVPTLMVDENDNIQMRGDANVTILIDGRPTAMPANQLLKQIPASAIEKIELITNPSAKYDPEGMSGIINIILKKNQLSGFNGNVDLTAGYGKFPKYSGSLGLNYRTPKLNVFANYSYNWRKVWFGGYQNRDVLLGDTLWDRLRQTDYGERINTAHSGRAGIDFFINDYNTIYVSGSANVGHNLGSREVNYENFDEDDYLLRNSVRNGSIDAPSLNYSVNGGWQKSFKKEGHILDLDVTYNQSLMTADENLDHEYFDINNQSYLLNYQNTLEESAFTTSISKLDYVLPITDSLTLEAGFHFTHRLSDNLFYSESAGDDQQFSEDTTISNQFEYIQNTFAPYVTLGKQFKKIGIKAGLRAEQTLTDAELINTQEVFENDYFKLFPSVHLSYKTQKHSEFQLSYSKRINRPRSHHLNPFTNYSDPLTLQTGNAFLRPEIIHVNELSYLKYWKKFNISTSVYYRYITDLIRRNLTNDGVQSTVSFTNLGTSSLTGGDFTMTLMPLKGMRITSSTSLWNTSTRDEVLTGGDVVHYFGVNTSLQGIYRLKKGWTFSIWASYSPTLSVIQGNILPNYGGGFAVQKQVLKNRGTLSLSVVDILKTRQFTFESYDLGNYTFNSQRRWESRSAYLSFTYNFGKMVQGKNRRNSNSTDSSDDRSIPELQ